MTIFGGLQNDVNVKERVDFGFDDKLNLTARDELAPKQDVNETLGDEWLQPLARQPPSASLKLQDFELPPLLQTTKPESLKPRAAVIKQDRRISLPPEAQYVHIKRNTALDLNRVAAKIDKDRIEKCECMGTDPCLNNCINRELNIECTTASCSLDAAVCKNRRIQVFSEFDASLPNDSGCCLPTARRGISSAVAGDSMSTTAFFFTEGFFCRRDANANPCHSRRTTAVALALGCLRT